MSAVLARGVRATGIELQYCSLLNDVASMHYSNAKMLQERPPVRTRDAYEIERLICDHLRKSIELYDDLLKRLIDGDMSTNRRLRDTPLLRSFECHYRLASLYHKLYRDEVGEARHLLTTRVRVQLTSIGESVTETQQAMGKARTRLRQKARVAHVQYAHTMAGYMRARHLWTISTSNDALRAQMERVALLERACADGECARWTHALCTCIWFAQICHRCRLLRHTSTRTQSATRCTSCLSCARLYWNSWHRCRPEQVNSGAHGYTFSVQMF